MLRTIRFALFMIIILLLYAFTAGCQGNTTLKEILRQKGISADSVADTRIELRFLKESKGANYKYADLTENEKFAGELLEALAACKVAKQPDEPHFSPELQSDYEIVLSTEEGEMISLYHIAQKNLVIFPERNKNKDCESLRYRYYEAGTTLEGLLQSQHQAAQMKQDTAVKPFRSMEELIASIEQDELFEEGQELDFEFFTAQTPQDAGTACRIYTCSEYSEIPQDSILVVAHGKTKAGEQQKLSILGIEANSHFTIFLVAEPDEALDSVDTGGDTPDSYAVTVKTDAIDPAKWIVFLNAENRILDVILPENIGDLK
jgi:hypothetical protein